MSNSGLSGTLQIGEIYWLGDDVVNIEYEINIRGFKIMAAKFSSVFICGILSLSLLGLLGDEPLGGYILTLASLFIVRKLEKDAKAQIVKLRKKKDKLKLIKKFNKRGKYAYNE